MIKYTLTSLPCKVDREYRLHVKVLYMYVFCTALASVLLLMRGLEVLCKNSLITLS